ncbi:MAG: DUF559 domain-containing protein [Gemmatimonadetes bacterium]|nr:DUF559 domain-containing protein [Gemmatimonadota bacterium]
MIAALAAGQHGVVARGQLLRAGVTLDAIDYRVRTGRLETLHRGVYRVGPLKGRLEREMAAVLACGETVVLSHRSAAMAWRLLPYRDDGRPVDVSVRRGCPDPGPGVRVHRIPRLEADETTVHEGIPVTTPARTLLDLVGDSREHEVEQALAGAYRNRLTNPRELKRLLARHAGRRGTRTLRLLLGRGTGPAFTRSEAESQFLALVRRAEIPAPETNVVLSGFEVDFHWPEARLVVEVDGFAFHASRHAFERDRRRDAVLAAAGYRVIRVTWRELTARSEALLVRLARALTPPTGR